MVQTGLDLIDWTSIVWYETAYSVYTMRQASRRSWRIGQRQPVEVTYLVYEGTLQAEALALVAAKMRSALIVEGDLPEEGLAALESDGQDVFLALARRLAEQSAGDGQSLEALFAQTRAIEAEADDYLVVDDWLVEATAPTPGGEAFSAGMVADLWQQTFAGQVPPGERPPDELTVGGNGRVMTFVELQRFVRRPKPRRKPVPAGQLALFGG